MELSRYLDCLRADGDRLVRAADQSLTRAVPSCSNRTVLDLVLLTE
ncbi:MAG TPA: hypothetical protein VKG85_03230 [Actinomycetes bacterium]|nr:hypothetical protein [Actinomycetes bacterium]